MRSAAVEEVFRALWVAREECRGRIASEVVAAWGRRVSVACAADVMESADYNPEDDKRVLWAREVLLAARRRDRACRASAELEALGEFLLGVAAVAEPCGKDLAAGKDD